MPAWAGKWRGGRFYLDDEGRRVFVIEAMRAGVRYVHVLETHDEELALGELVRFNSDPGGYRRVEPAQRPSVIIEPVLITKERLIAYMQSIGHAVEDHRKARRSYLHAWAEAGVDLRTADRRELRRVLGTFTLRDGRPAGGHRGRVEALNAFARFLVREGDLASWVPLTSLTPPKPTRAERQSYSLEQLGETFARLGPGPVRDLFTVRVATGMHHTEIEQLELAKVLGGPLPDQGTWIRELPKGHEIVAVLQVVHRKKSKKERRHRVSVDGPTYEAVLRLRERVPDRITVWEALDPLVPSNLRHTFTTLAGEVGELVTYKAAGVDRSRIAQVLGHRAGSTMTADRYDKLQVPPMVRIPFPWRPLDRDLVNREPRL